ncbi:Chaperone protein DnaJ [Minicystis rosea]|nr:Chaperone protein DnaJ [Minicystis rosea]
MPDPYNILGVDRSATQDEIKSAFRRLASQHHPDKNPGDTGAHQRFKEINAAYQILSDPQKRAAFDRYGEAAMGGAAGGPGGPFAGGVPFDMADLNIDGIFGDLLGALGIKVGDRGALQKEIRITFEEAAFGCTKEIKYERVESCEGCAGSGSAPGSSAERCPACAGRGRVRFQQGVLPIAIERPCSRCHGTGRVVVDPCTTCRGAGLVGGRTRTIEVTIPPGVENGATRLVERGGNVPRPDRPPGDLELIIRVTPHDFFRRAGDDVVCAMPISFASAALGGELAIPTLDGKGKLRIPPGTQPGSVLRVKGKGIPRRTGGRGDQLVEVTIEVPTQLTSSQKELIAKLAEELGESVQPQQATFMEKLRSLFG